jgi:hypothetical protein
MKLPKLSYEPGALVDFFTEALQSIGAVCERTWHDRLQVLAEGKAARIWSKETGALVDLELNFPAAGDPSPRDAAREVFPGCPLTFHLAERVRGEALSLERAAIRFDELRAPSADTAARTWQTQFPHLGRFEQARPFAQDWAFSILCLVRCEVQAIDQHWSLHRLAMSWPEGLLDHDLASRLDFADTTGGSAIIWPSVDPHMLHQFICRAVEKDAGEELSGIRVRQEHYLKRELDRIDKYFENYERELRSRRQSTKEKTLKLEERLAAARAEHERRRQDQVQRHEIVIIPHMDALLFLAEPCWKTAVRKTKQPQELTEALFIPRSRRWRLIQGP